MHVLTKEKIEGFGTMLIEAERSADTVLKYLRDVRAFYCFLPVGKPVDKEAVIAYKRHITARYKTASANSMLVAINGMLTHLGWQECRVRQLKSQRQRFRESERELSREEYLRLLRAASSRQNARLYLLMQAICSTGIRVSEHKFITVEAVCAGQVCVCNKGKVRPVFIPEELKAPLLRYCKERGIVSGSVFVTKSGKPLDRSNIWAAMKKLCAAANVAREKIYPHNLRHLFALTYYRLEKDIVRLADILGHSSVETTRIYTATNCQDHKKMLSRLKLVCLR